MNQTQTSHMMKQVRLNDVSMCLEDHDVQTGSVDLLNGDSSMENFEAVKTSVAETLP